MHSYCKLREEGQKNSTGHDRRPERQAHQTCETGPTPKRRACAKRGRARHVDRASADRPPGISRKTKNPDFHVTFFFFFLKHWPLSQKNI